MEPDRNIARDCIETIKGYDRVLDQLRKLCEMHALVHFELGAPSPRSYISRFQGIHSNGALLIDPLRPSEGDRLIQEATSVKACYSLDDGRYEFDTSVVGLINSEPSALMLLRPSVILRIQMRRYARISIPEESALPVKIIRNAQASEPVNGSVVQLGSGGMGVIVASAEGWGAGMNIEKIMFALPDGHTIYTAATVRSLIPLYNSCGSIINYRCNLQFVQLEHRFSTVLEAFIFRKQMEENAG